MAGFEAFRGEKSLLGEAFLALKGLSSLNGEPSGLGPGLTLFIKAFFKAVVFALRSSSVIG